MKKTLIACSVLLSCAAFGVAIAADDAATLFKAQCQGCHGVEGSRASKGGEPLKGQNADSLTDKLLGYKAGTYGGQSKQVMEGAVKSLSEDQLKSLAEYLSTR